MFSVIFDMDGTLLDTQKICIPAWDYAGCTQGIASMGKHIPNVCGMSETGWTDYLKVNFPELDIESFKSDVIQYITVNGSVCFKKGAEELLDFLKAHGIKTAIASGSSTAIIKQHLEKLNALNSFNAIVGGNDVENSKPAPDIFLKAASLLDVHPKECFVLEDSANGILAGSAAGMKCIGIPDIVEFSDELKKLMFAQVTDLSEIIPIFKEHLNY